MADNSKNIKGSQKQVTVDKMLRDIASETDKILESQHGHRKAMLELGAKDQVAAAVDESIQNKITAYTADQTKLMQKLVKARMMGLKVITNKHVGATHEPWFELKGRELINLMSQRRDQIPNKIIEIMHGQPL